jgi:hypothetical protein
MIVWWSQMVNVRGQIFSPDIIFAVLVFLAALVLFNIASSSVLAQEDLFELRSEADEVLHATMNSLVLSSGRPNDWDVNYLHEISFFGLAKERNVLDRNKIITVINFLDNNYSLAKENLGVGKFAFKLKLIDFNGSVLYSSTRVFSNTKLEQGSSRVVSVDGTQMILEGIIAYER